MGGTKGNGETRQLRRVVFANHQKARVLGAIPAGDLPNMAYSGLGGKTKQALACWVSEYDAPSPWQCWQFATRWTHFHHLWGQGARRTLSSS